MAFGSQKAACVMLLAAALPAVAESHVYSARHARLLVDHTVTLTIDDKGVAFEQVDPKGKKRPEKLEKARWSYLDIQQLTIAPGRIRVLLYRDRAPWLLGFDAQYEFALARGVDPRAAVPLLESRLDRRLVVAMAAETTGARVELNVKRLGLLRGSEGLLKFGEDRIVYETARRGESRTWRFADIENISSTDPYQLTLTTFERAVAQYGSRKDFVFQLKEPLPERLYTELWRSLNRRHGLDQAPGTGRPVPLPSSFEEKQP